MCRILDLNIKIHTKPFTRPNSDAFETRCLLSPLLTSSWSWGPWVLRIWSEDDLTCGMAMNGHRIGKMIWYTMVCEHGVSPFQPNSDVEHGVFKTFEALSCRCWKGARSTRLDTIHSVNSTCINVISLFMIVHVRTIITPLHGNLSWFDDWFTNTFDWLTEHRLNDPRVCDSNATECDSLWQDPCRRRTPETSSSKKAFANAFCASR